MKNYLRVARLPFLLPGFGLYALGALWALQAGAGFSLLPFLWGYLSVLPAQLSVHFSNDYFDALSDRASQPTLISGGGGVLQSHPELRQRVKWIAIGLILLSVVFGTVLILTRHLSAWLFVLLVLGNLIGWFYSAPPLRFSARGAGEWCFPALAGILVPVLGYLAQRGQIDSRGWYFIPALLLLTFASVLTVEIPDVEADRAGGKRTLVARMGRRVGFIPIGLFLLAADVCLFLAPLPYYPNGGFRPAITGLLFFVPLAPGLAGLVRRPERREPATRIAVAIIITLTVFILLVDGYLLWLAV